MFMRCYQKVPELSSPWPFDATVKACGPLSFYAMLSESVHRVSLHSGWLCSISAPCLVILCECFFANFVMPINLSKELEWNTFLYLENCLLKFLQCFKRFSKKIRLVGQRLLSFTWRQWSSGWPSVTNIIENNEAIQLLIHKVRLQTIQNFCRNVCISNGSCRDILTEGLSKHHIAEKFVLCLMSLEQKQLHFDMCSERRETSENDPTGSYTGFMAMTQKLNNSRTVKTLRLNKTQQVKSAT